MSYCLNPNCFDLDMSSNFKRNTCFFCGSELILNGQYRVMNLLSEGGFSRIYEVDNCGKKKILKLLLSTSTDRVISVFQREAEILKKLNHPKIPKVGNNEYFTIQLNGNRRLFHCLIMEKFDGQNLKEWLVQQRYSSLSTELGITWLRQLLEILDYLHKKNYVHRDIKPENIILRPNGELGLIDFGCARKIDDSYILDLVEDGVTNWCSHGYSPPEQKRGYPVKQSDFYALSRTFVYLLTGTHPNYIPDELGKLIWRDKAKQVPVPLADLLDEMMAYDIRDRPKNVEVILRKLENFFEPSRQLYCINRINLQQLLKLPMIGIVLFLVYSGFLSLNNQHKKDIPNKPLPPDLQSLVPRILCKNRECIGRDPKDNGCAPNASTPVTLTSVLVNADNVPDQTFRMEIRYSPLCHSTWVRSWAPHGSFHYLEDRFGKHYGAAKVKKDSSLPHQYSDMGPADIDLRACIRQPKGSIMCTNFISMPKNS